MNPAVIRDRFASLLVIPFVTFSLLGCDDGSAGKPRNPSAKEKSFLNKDDSETDGDDADKENNAGQGDTSGSGSDGTGTSGGSGSSDGDADAEDPGDGPSDDPSEDGEESDDSEDEVDLVSGSTGDLTVTGVRRENSDATISVRPEGKGAWKTIPWPKDGESVKVSGVCPKGKKGKIEVRFSAEEFKDVGPPNAAIGLSTKAGLTAGTTVGFEVDGGCEGAGCQDDNIASMSCTGPVSIKGL